MGIRRKNRLIEGEQQFGDAAEHMVRSQLRARGIEAPNVLAEMRSVPRHVFVADDLRSRAYDDSALPTMHGQTISQPYIVALMTERLDVAADHRVLEIGTGSGYQTAILARMADSVVTIEREADLAEHARAMLQRFNIDNVSIVIGDGTAGAPRHAPFDRIIVTAGAPTVPEPLKEQLADGGRMVIPVGDHAMQRMTVVTRRGETFDAETGAGCRFVPLVGEYGWKHGGSL